MLLEGMKIRLLRNQNTELRGMELISSCYLILAPSGAAGPHQREQLLQAEEEEEDEDRICTELLFQSGSTNVLNLQD